ALTLTNVSDEPKPITAVAAVGDDGAQFNVAGNCPTVLTLDATCTIEVRFAPTSAGNKSAQLVVSSDGPPITHALAGTATPFVPNDPVQLFPSLTKVSLGSRCAKATSSKKLKLRFNARDLESV